MPVSHFVAVAVLLVLVRSNDADSMAKRIAWKRANDVDVSNKGPVISISSMLRDPRQLPFNQIFFGSDWQGKVMNQIQGYNELFKELDSETRRRRRRRSVEERGGKWTATL